MRRLLFIASSMLLAACGGGGGDGTTTPPATAGISISSSASSGTIARGTSATTSLTVGRTGSFVGTVTLTAEGAPTGVTVQFSPASLGASTSSSTATISVDQSAAPGSSTITLRASGSGVTSQTASYTVTVPTPAITVSAGSGTASVVQGTSTTVPITISRTNGASGAVALTATGAPTGTTVSFAPASIGAADVTSTMTLDVGSATAVGSYPITVSAAATGVTTQTATVQLTVTAPASPAYTISPTPAALSIVAGQQGTSTLTLSKTGGFAGNVTLSLEGAPVGVTGAFAPNPATGTTSTLTLSSTGATVPGTYNLTVRGVASGLTDRTTTVALTVAAAPGVTVTLAPTSLSVPQSSNGQTAVTLARTGGLTGDIAMTATGAPAGMTISFAPATVTASASTMTVTVGAAVATGTYPIVVTGTGTGNVTGTATLSVAVTTAQGFTLSATAASVVQSATGTSTVTITRVGGYANSVDLTATNLPSGVTASFAPASVAGTTSTLTFTASAGATPGTYTNVTVNGTGTGATNQSTTLSLTVTASGGGGGGAIAWRFCDPARVPLWFAYRDGTSGAWTRVTVGSNSTFSFTFSNSVGAVAYVQNASGGGYQGTIFLNTASEMAGIATSECTSSPDTKSLTASFAGLTTSVTQLQSGTASIGSATGTASTAGTSFAITNVPNRLADVLAYRTTTSLSPFGQSIDKVVLRRSVNYPANSVVPVIDFDGAESFVPVAATYTLANAGADQTSIISTFQTANGTAGSLVNVFGTAVLGVPASKTQAGDLHTVFATASAGTTNIRIVAQYNKDLVNRTLTFGSALNLPTIAVPGAGRVKVSGAWQAEYGDAGSSAFAQGTAATSRSWTISGSRGYFGAGSSQYEFELFDFSGVAGFQNTWSLAVGTSTQVTTNIAGSLVGTYPNVAEGNSFKTAARVQTVTP